MAKLNKSLHNSRVDEHDSDEEDVVSEMPANGVDELDCDDLRDYVPVPPDGGWGWVVVFASFVANLVVDGIAYSFGMFLRHFQRHYQSPQSWTAMVGSLLAGCYLVAGPIVGGLVNRYGSRAVMMVGSLVSTVAFFVSVWAPNLPLLMLSYGVIGGVGFGLIYLPAIVHVGFYFEKKRALATGIAVAGSGVGTFVFAPLTVYLIREYTWTGALWILSGFILNCVACGALLRPLRPKKDPKQLQRNIDRQVRNAIERAVSTQSGMSAEPPQAPQTRLPPLDVRQRGAVSESTASPLRALRLAPGVSYSPVPDRESGRLDATVSLNPVTGDALTDGRRRRSTRAASRVSAATYGASLLRLNSAADAQSLACLADVRAAAFARPMSRRDIFFSGSIDRLAEFTGDVAEYRQRQTLVEMAAAAASDGVDATLESLPATSVDALPALDACCPHVLPASVRVVVGEMLDMRLLRRPAMLLLALSNAVAFLGFYVPFIFISDRARAYGVRARDASLLLSVIGVTNTAGRVLFGWLCDRQWLSALAINNMCLLSCGLLTLAFPFFAASYQAMTVYAALFGLLICKSFTKRPSATLGALLAAYISLTSIYLVDLLGLENLSNSFGLLTLSRGVSAIVGTPLAGAIYDMTTSYDASFVYAGVLLTVAAVVSCLIPMVDRPPTAAKRSASS